MLVRAPIRARLGAAVGMAKKAGVKRAPFPLPPPLSTAAGGGRSDDHGSRKRAADTRPRGAPEMARDTRRNEFNL